MKQTQPTLLDLLISCPPLPWRDYKGPGDVGSAIEQVAHSRVAWAPMPRAHLDRSCTGDADAPQRALAAQVLRAQNAVLERLVSNDALNHEHSGPTETIARLVPAFVRGDRSPEVHQRFKQFVCVDNFAQREAHKRSGVLDVRDSGLGLDRHDLLDVFDSIDATWAIKQRLSVRPSYMYAPLTIIASRRKKEGRVAITAIKRLRGNPHRYHHIVTRDGVAPMLNLSEDQFPVGTLVRFVGFEGELYNGFKERSVQGALDRILPAMSYPVPTNYHELGMAPPRTQLKLAVGGLLRLEALTRDGKVKRVISPRDMAGESFEVRRYEFGPSRNKSGANDELRWYCCPREPVLIVCEGQTIASAARPRNSAFSKPTLVVIDCSRMSPEKRQQICTDEKWRDELVSEAFVKRSRHTSSSASSPTAPSAPTADLTVELPIVSKSEIAPLPARVNPPEPAPRPAGYKAKLRSAVSGFVQRLLSTS